MAHSICFIILYLLFLYYSCFGILIDKRVNLINFFCILHLTGFFIRPFYKMMLEKPITLSDMEPVVWKPIRIIVIIVISISSILKIYNERDISLSFLLFLMPIHSKCEFCVLIETKWDCIMYIYILKVTSFDYSLQRFFENILA